MRNTRLYAIPLCETDIQIKSSRWLLVMAFHSQDHISKGSLHFRNQDCMPQRKSFESFTGLVDPSLPILRIKMCLHSQSLKL